MKTSYTPDEIVEILQNLLAVDAKSVQQLTEGHSSQVYSFTAINGQKLVLRIRESEKDLLADKYAYDHFGSSLPIPQIMGIGKLPAIGYYCISEFIDGQTLYSLDGQALHDLLPRFHQMLVNTFTLNVSGTHGYGSIDVATGNALADSWKSSLRSELESLDVDLLKTHAANIALEADMINRLVEQFNSNLPYASEVRRLLHGDPGYDNVIVDEGKIKAVIDWEQMAYGDWARDFSRFEYFDIADCGDMLTFGMENGLEIEHLHERKALYWAINALRDIEFASSQKNQQVAARLRANLGKRLI